MKVCEGEEEHAMDVLQPLYDYVYMCTYQRMTLAFHPVELVEHPYHWKQATFDKPLQAVEFYLTALRQALKDRAIPVLQTNVREVKLPLVSLPKRNEWYDAVALRTAPLVKKRLTKDLLNQKGILDNELNTNKSIDGRRELVDQLGRSITSLIEKSLELHHEDFDVPLTKTRKLLVDKFLCAFASMTCQYCIRTGKKDELDDEGVRLLSFYGGDKEQGMLIKDLIRFERRAQEYHQKPRWCGYEPFELMNRFWGSLRFVTENASLFCATRRFLVSESKDELVRACNPIMRWLAKDGFIRTLVLGREIGKQDSLSAEDAVVCMKTLLAICSTYVSERVDEFVQSCPPS
jgi:hypothetical protein